MKPSPLSQFDELKIVVFFELEPLTDDFEQMMLTKEQYKKLLDCLEEMLPPNGRGGRVITTDEDEAHNFANIRTFYSDKEVNDPAS